jgi:protein-S-isoprenylcysteine O-methyltransferase Ste14
MDSRILAFLAAGCLSVYWFWVAVMLFKLGRKIGKDPNAVPREFVGKMMRLLWYPCVLWLIAALWLAAWRRPVPYAPILPWARAVLARLIPPTGPWWAMALAATLAGTICLVLTFVCWRKMGRSWRIGIDPHEKLALVSTGPYRYVRHPIYALRMVIDLCAVIMVPTVLVLVPAVLDIVLLQIEARREERYMESKHGEAYAAYKNSVGRFLPRAFMV